MLLSIEVAVEYWLSLTWSPQAQWLSDSTHDSPLRDEVSLQLHIHLGDDNSHRRVSRVARYLVDASTPGQIFVTLWG